MSILMARRIWGPSFKDARRSSDNTVIKTCISCLSELRDTERAKGALENTASMVSVRQLISRRTVASGCWLDSTFGMWVVKVIFSCKDAAFRNYNENILQQLGRKSNASSLPHRLKFIQNLSSISYDGSLVGRKPTLGFPAYFVSNVPHVQWAIPQT